MCIKHQLVLGPEAGRASGEQSRLDHPEGETGHLGSVHLTLLPELSPHFFQLLLKPTSSWAARAKLESSLTPVQPHGTWGMSLTRWLPWTTSPSPKVLDPGPTPFLCQTPAQPTSPQSSCSSSASSCHFTLRVAGDGTWSESHPDSFSLPTNQESGAPCLSIYPGMCMKSLKLESRTFP